MSNAHLLPPTAANHLRANLGFYLLLTAGSCLMVGPFVWMASTALKLPGDQFDHRLIPSAVTLANFTKAWALMDFSHLLWNSFSIAALSTMMTMELSADGVMRQWTQSVGGGSDWSSNGGRRLDFDGQWRADGQTLSVMGMGLVDFMPAAAYEFSGDFLVTHNDMGRLTWRRRG